MMNSFRIVQSVFLVLLLAGFASGQSLFQVKVSSETARAHALVKIPLVIEESTEIPSSVLLKQGERAFVGQVSERPPSRDKNANDPTTHELQFVLDSIDANETIELSAFKFAGDETLNYEWHDDRSEKAMVEYDGKPVLAYMYRELDNSTPELRGQTYKVFHHVYRPDGKALMTKGPGGLFPHHRGIFLGFNRISYGSKSADVWHCKKGESQNHIQSLEKLGGPVFARDSNLIEWRGQDGKTFALEIRQLTTSKVEGKIVVDFHSSVQNRTTETIKFRGDPQHAGAQFRASQDVPDHTKKLTYYIRPDGVGKPGKFRNWSNKKNESELNKKHINLAWNALCMFLPKDPGRAEGQLSADQCDPFTVCYLDSPNNPKPARFSERDYGRFGSYFEYDLKPSESLTLDYRFVISPGILTIEQIEKLSEDFVTPVKAEQIGK